MFDPSIAQYLPLVFGGLFLIGCAIVAVMSSAAGKKRSDALVNFARSAGLQCMFETDTGMFSGGYSDSTDDRILDKFEGFKPFGQGHMFRMRNLIIGTRDGVDWCMFDYFYTVGSGRDQTRYHYAIAAANVPFVFPEINLKPETILTRVGEHLGLRELNFEVNEFNQRYYVTSTDEKRAYDILCPQTIECLLTFPPRWWQLGGSFIVIVREGDLVDDMCFEIMQEIPAFLSKIPNYVRQDIGFEPQNAGASDQP